MQVSELQAQTNELAGAGEQTVEELSQNKEQLQALQSKLEHATAAGAEKDKELQQWLADFVDLRAGCPILPRTFEYS